MEKGLDFKELQKLLCHIMEHNSWLNMYNNNCVKGLNIPCDKYVNFCLDTRTGDIWRVAFGNGEGSVEFRTEWKIPLKEQIYKYLSTERG